MASTVFIGITGASASGKTLLSHTIYDELVAEIGPDDIAIVSEDRYYRAQDHVPVADRDKTNYDHPRSLEHELLVRHMDALAAGDPVDLPEYDYVAHTRKPQVTHLTPRRVVILEGILLLTEVNIRHRLHASVFVDTPLDVCLARRLRRDCSERGRTMESVLSQYEGSVRPMFLQFVEPSKRYADIIVPRGGKNRFAIDLLKAKIAQMIPSIPPPPMR